MKNLITKLEKLFADVDAKTIARQRSFINNAIAEIIIAKNTRDLPDNQRADDYCFNTNIEQIMETYNLKKDFVGMALHSISVYEHIFAVKKLLDEAVKPLLEKQEKRNYRIAKKLFDKGITDIDQNFQIIYGNDFEGEWVIGDKLVSLKVIFAGGYNIQPLHNRVLVHVKECA